MNECRIFPAGGRLDAAGGVDSPCAGGPDRRRDIVGGQATGQGYRKARITRRDEAIPIDDDPGPPETGGGTPGRRPGIDKQHRRALSQRGGSSHPIPRRVERGGRRTICP